MNPIKDAITLAGSVTVLARSLGVTPQAVCFWRDGKRQVPADKCPLIERVTVGAVTCESLRPDVDWNYIRETAKFPVNATKAATETVAVDAVTTEVGALRTGDIRRHANRRAQDLPIDLDRRAAEGPPFQSPETGVANVTN